MNDRPHRLTTTGKTGKQARDLDFGGGALVKCHVILIGHLALLRIQQRKQLTDGLVFLIQRVHLCADGFMRLQEVHKLLHTLGGSPERVQVRGNPGEKPFVFVEHKDREAIVVLVDALPDRRQHLVLELRSFDEVEPHFLLQRHAPDGALLGAVHAQLLPVPLTAVCLPHFGVDIRGLIL